MAEITRTTNYIASLASLLPPATNQHTGLYAGEAIGGGDLVYIKSDGLVWKATGAAANAAAQHKGVVLIPVDAGDPCTVMWDITINYPTASTLTPGAFLYLSGVNAGQFADAASTGGTKPAGYVVDVVAGISARIYVYQYRP